MRLRLPEWLYADPQIHDLTNRELSAREHHTVLVRALATGSIPVQQVVFFELPGEPKHGQS